MGRPGVAGKKRTRPGGRDPGDPPLRRWRCLCPWSKQRGNPPFSSASRSHSYSNDSAAGPRAATFPGPREPPLHPHFPLAIHKPRPPPPPALSTAPGRGPWESRVPSTDAGASHQLRCWLWGTERVAEGEAGDMGRGRGPDADRLTYRVMGRGARVGG